MALAVTLAVLAALVLIAFVLLLKGFRVPSASMAPTIEPDQRIVVTRGTDPEVGKIMVFHPPAGAVDGRCGQRIEIDELCPTPTRERADVTFVARVVAGPGDRLRMKDGRALVDGRSRREAYAQPCTADEGCDYPREITIPDGHWFMLGDNRGESADSRFYGPVPDDWFVGAAFASYWPLDQIGLY